ncbi:hypothetical protein ElyMa_006780100 [Elysia marginata]|uniref:Uncharacterized protein n=1 Tax=Elysia marginata TaxID=1093978 RepID=A0AAV4J3H2_9GAST|nr:hypothetical protein ElyMa_006780100 [Elysia marginata]
MEKDTTSGVTTNGTETTENATEIVSTNIATPEASSTDPVVIATTPQTGQEDTIPLAVILGVVGAVVCLIGILVVVCCLRKRRKREKKVPPELPHPFALTTQDNTTEPNVIFHAAPSRESSSSAQVQMVSYKPLPGTQLVPARKPSSPTSVSISVRDSRTGKHRSNKLASSSSQETQSIYSNGEVVAASVISRSPPAATVKEASNDEEQSRDSLYIRPSSWYSTRTSDQCEVSTSVQSEVDDAGGHISRSRLDSQKYLLPAELILQLPQDVRKMSGESLGGDVESRTQSPHSNGLQIKWKAQAPIIHSAEEPDRTSSVYVCMDSGSQPTNPLSRDDSKQDSDGCIPPRSLPPPPCRKITSQSGYINVNAQGSRISDTLQPPSPLEDHYEAVSSLVSPTVYGNAREILKSQLSSSETSDDRNSPDTYNVCPFPEPPTSTMPISETNDISGQDTLEQNAVQSQKETKVSDSIPTGEQLNEQGRHSLTMSYVNVAQFQKQLSEIEESSSPTQEVGKKPEHPAHEKSPGVGADAGLEVKEKAGKGKRLSQPKPPKSKKPTTLPKPKTSHKKDKDSGSLGRGLAGLKQAVRPSLKQKIKERMSYRSSSSHDKPSEAKRNPSKNPTSNPPNTKQSPPQTESPAIKTPTGDCEVEPTEYQNLLPTTIVPTVEDKGKEIKPNSNGSAQPDDGKEKDSHAHKTKPVVPKKGQNRKSGSVLRAKLDLSELKSKLRKTQKSFTE